jgi:nucleoside-diphosphate-sugar epimerase
VTEPALVTGGAGFGFIGSNLVLELLRPGRRAVNVGRGERRTVNDLLAVIRALVPGDHPEPIHAAPRPDEVRDSWSDIAEARATIGYDPEIPFGGGLCRTLARIVRDRP